MSSEISSGPSTSIARFVPVFFGAYLLGAELGKLLSFAGESCLTFWPPIGLFVATLAISRRRHWPLWISTAVAANLASDLLLHNGLLATGLGFCATHVASACLGGWLLQRVAGGVFRIERVRDVANLLVCGAFVPALVSATFGATTIVARGDPASFGHVWWVWWLADIVGVLVVAPPLLLLPSDARPLTRLATRRRWETAVMFALLIVISVIAFGAPVPWIGPLFKLPLLTLPSLMWVAMRFDRRGAAVASAVVALIAIAGTTQGYGLFAESIAAIPLRYGALQLFVVTSVLTPLLCATIIAEQQRAVDELGERARLAALTSDIAMALNRGDDLATMLRGCAELLVQHLDVAVARIWTMNATEQVLELQASAGLYTHLTGAHARVPVGSLKIGMIAAERRPHLTNTIAGVSRIRDQEWTKRAGIGAFAGYPLILDDRVVGVMAAFAKRPLSDVTLKSMAAVADGLALGIERKRAEAALRTSENRFRRLADGVPVFIWMSGPDKLCHYFNRSWLDFRGRTMEQEINNGWAEGVHPEDLDRCRQTYTESFDRRQPFEIEYRLRRHDGEYRWVLGTGIPLFASDGALEGYLGGCLDITERRQIQEALQAMNAELDRRVRGRTTELNEAYASLQRALKERIRGEDQMRHHQALLAHTARVSTMGEMAASLAHELNQPLYAITNYARGTLRKLNNETCSPDEVRATLDQVALEAVRAGAIIRHVRGFVRQQESQTEPVSLNQVVRDAVSMTDFETRRHQVQVRFAMADLLPPVEAEAVQLEQVIVNLIHNACEAMENSPLERRELLLETTINNGSVVFAIHDQGSGLAPSEVNKIFDAFFTTKPSGMGMGLAISRTIIEAYGGRLWAEPRPDGGATLRFTLPRATSRVAGDSSAAAPHTVAPISDALPLATSTVTHSVPETPLA